MTLVPRQTGSWAARAAQGRKLAGLPRSAPRDRLKMKTRNALLIVPVALLAATLCLALLCLALPNLGVELAGAEELVQTQTLTPEEKQPDASASDSVVSPL